MSSVVEELPPLSDLIAAPAAVLEINDGRYERWRVTTPDAASALVERWPSHPESAARAAAAARWLRPRLGGPNVLVAEGDAVLVELPDGLPASVPVSGLHPALQALGTALARLHALDPTGLRQHRSVDDLVTEAHGRIAEDELSADSFRPAYRRYSPARLLELARASLPEDAQVGDLVVTHGSPALTNLFVAGDDPSGWLCLDRLAVADRHLDLARVAKQLAERFGGEALTVFFDAYGTAPDVRRLDAYALLDELLP